MTGETDHKLRGDYSRMRPDYTVDQDWDAYTRVEHDLWRRLYARQAALIPNYACDEFSDTLKVLNFGEGRYPVRGAPDVQVLSGMLRMVLLPWRGRFTHVSCASRVGLRGWCNRALRKLQEYGRTAVSAYAPRSG